jgi:sporulation protein YlmC with PRC-barrel domain
VRLELGTPVHCSDRKFGELTDVVIDPGTRSVTHLVVKSHHVAEGPRLVPISLVDPDEAGAVHLRCTVTEAAGLDAVQDFAYLRMGESVVDDPNWDVGIERVLTVPNANVVEAGGESLLYDDHVTISYDRVPKGEVEIRRLSAVVDRDAKLVGHVDGFVIGTEEGITHLVLRHGHLWRKHKIAVPIEAVTRVETDKVTINLSARDVGRLPAVRA